MIYSELKDICRVNKISVQSVADEVGLSLDGLKKGLNNQSLAIRYVLPLCQSLCLTPDQFFGKKSAHNIQQQYGGVGNTQVIGAGINALQQQLEEKDKQISRLMDLLANK